MGSITYESINDEWEEDSKIDPDDLGNELIKVLAQHTKYLKFLSYINENLLKYEDELFDMEKIKYKYYQLDDGLSEGYLRDKGWDLDPYHGRAKPKTKSDFDKYYNADSDLKSIKRKINKLKNMRDQIQEIIKMIHQKSFLINNLSRMRGEA